MPPATDQIETALLAFLRRRLEGIGPLTPQTDLLAEGLLDSLLVLDLAAAVEKQWGVRLENADIAPRHFRSVSALAALVAARAASL